MQDQGEVGGARSLWLFDRFELLSRLGEGGFGSVYRAIDHVLGHEVAFKRLHRMSASSVAMFKREFRSVSTLVHPNLVRLGELFGDEATLGFSMEYVPGVDVLSWVRAPAAGAAADEGRMREAFGQLAAAKRDLLVRAAQRLLQAGHVDAGMSAAGRAMKAADLPWPAFSHSVISRIVWDSLALVGHRATSKLVRSAPRAAAIKQRQLDTLWRLLHPLYLPDVLRTAAVSARHLRLAEELGDVRHLALGYAAHSLLLTMRKSNSQRARELGELAARFRDEDGTTSVRAYERLTAGGRALFQCDLRAAASSLEEADRLYSEECRGEPWYHAAARGTYLRVLWLRGEHRKFAMLSEAWVRDARARGDAHALAQYVCVGHGATRHLLHDEPARALEELEQSLRPWRTGRIGMGGFTESTVLSSIFAYQLHSALRMPEEWIEEKRRTLASALPGIVRELTQLGTTDLLLSWELQAHAAEFKPSAKLSRSVDRLMNASSPRARASAGLMAAQLALLVGQPRRALGYATDARDLFSKVGQDLHAMAAELLAACAQSAVEARAIKQQLKARLLAEGWVNPDRALTSLIPAYVEQQRARIPALLS